MPCKLLLTSFDTWLPHQRSNSSDDLLEVLQQRSLLQSDWVLLRKLEVDEKQSSTQVLAQIQQLQPERVVCLGMAESREGLTLESNARSGNHCLQTNVDLATLVKNLTLTSISHDAGRFVCESLYYATLNYLGQCTPQAPCLFVHVPLLSEQNLNQIVVDFLTVLQRLGASEDG